MQCHVISTKMQKKIIGHHAYFIGVQKYSKWRHYIFMQWYRVLHTHYQPWLSDKRQQFSNKTFCFLAKITLIYTENLNFLTIYEFNISKLHGNKWYSLRYSSIDNIQTNNSQNTPSKSCHFHKSFFKVCNIMLETEKCKTIVGHHAYFYVMHQFSMLHNFTIYVIIQSVTQTL